MEKVTVEFTNNQLITKATYPAKVLELKVKNGTYSVGEQQEYTVTDVIPKENIPILMEYLSEQLSLVKDQYDMAKSELAKIPEALDKLSEILPAHTQALMHANSKQAKKLFEKNPVYVELAERVLKREQLKLRIKDLEPSVKKIQDQIKLVLDATKSL